MFEIIGYYGSGKSTICNKMKEAIGSPNCFVPESTYLKKRNSIGKVFYRLKHFFVFLDGSNHAIVKKTIKTIKDKKIKRFAKNYFYLLCCFYYDVLKYNKPFSILSEGFICLNWVIFKYSGILSNSIYEQKYFKELLGSTHFVFVKTDFEPNYNHLLERQSFNEKKSVASDDFLECNLFFEKEISRLNCSFTRLYNNYDLENIDLNFLGKIINIENV